MTHLPIKQRPLILGPDVTLPGSVAEALPDVAEHPDLATMRGNLPTLTAPPTNPALAFSQVTNEPAPSPVVTPPLVRAVIPVNAPGMEPTVYPRAPIKRRRQRRKV